MGKNAERVLNAVKNRAVKTTETEVKRNMTYSNGAWGDSHRG